MRAVSRDELQGRFLQIETLNTQCPKHEGVYMWRSVNPCTQNVLTYCPECTQDKINMQAGEQLAQAEAQIRNTRSYSLFAKESIIPTDLKNATIGNFEIHTEQDSAAVNFARRITLAYVKEQYEGNTIISGPPGVGKSHLAVGIAKTLNESFQKFQMKRSVRHPILTSASWRCFSLHSSSGDVYFSCPSNSASTLNSGQASSGK